MRTKKLFYLTIIILFAFIRLVEAQDYNLPPNPEPGKCYKRCFDYDKKFEWKEVDCSKEKERRNKKTKKQLIKEEQLKIKMIKYQEKLVSFGYKLEITGIPDNKTIIAHHKFLKKRQKEERKEKRRLKKSERKNRK
jgi:predicted HTH domain antitoxin